MKIKTAIRFHFTPIRHYISSTSEDTCKWKPTSDLLIHVKIIYLTAKGDNEGVGLYPNKEILCSNQQEQMESTLSSLI